MTSVTAPKTGPDTIPGTPGYDPVPVDTGPQRVLELVESGLTQIEVADLLHIAQSTVSRRIKEAREQRNIRYKLISRAALTVLATVCMLIITAAVSTIAWG